MSSSDISEVPQPGSSDSVDMTLGFNTEVGRSTVATPSSSSGTQALSDPTLGSTESSRPPSPPVIERGRPPPAPWLGPFPSQGDNLDGPPMAPLRRGDLTEQPPPAAASEPASCPSQTDAAGRALPTQSTGAAPAPAPPGDKAAGAALPPFPATTQPADNLLLQLLLQQNVQMLSAQNAQNAHTAQMMQMMQNMMTRQTTAPPAPVARVPPPPPLSELAPAGRPIAQAGWNP